MVSTWRYYSFKNVSLNKPYKPLLIVLLGALIYAIWNWSQPVLLAMAAVYLGSGIAIRIGGLIRRRFRHAPPHPPTAPEHQIG
jgi:CDP-diacylglycerol--serine O-phosphatidyltransferase